MFKRSATFKGEQWRKHVWVNVAENAEAVPENSLRKEGIDLSKQSITRYSPITLFFYIKKNLYKEREREDNCEILRNYLMNLVQEILSLEKEATSSSYCKL